MSNSGNRLAILKVLVVGVFLIILSGLVKSQVFSGGYYRQLAQGNRIREVKILAPRGIIYDRNNVPLTTNLPSFSVEQNEISKDQAIALESLGLSPVIKSRRNYPFGSQVAHALIGVETFYDHVLSGVDGKELIEVDALGQKLRKISEISAVAGQNLHLSLDVSLQRVAAMSLENKKGAVIVSVPKTGEILALFSAPAYDPNNIKDYLTATNQPFFDRAISGTYPPGSTFKIITAAAGLESGAITASTIIEDVGVLVIGPYKFPNWKYLAGGGVEGNLDVVGAIQKSNDIFFYQVGERVGIDNLIAWTKRFGLGAPLGIDLPGEAGGLVDKGRTWYLGDTYHYAIGQGDLLVTPLQVNAWTNVIAADGQLCKPHLFGEPSCASLNLKPLTLGLIKKGMAAACSSGGTGYPLFGFSPQVYCKTGTAEYGTESKTHAWFTAFTNDLSVTVLVEGGGEGSDVAAPIAKKIFEKYYTK